VQDPFLSEGQVRAPEVACKEVVECFLLCSICYILEKLSVHVHVLVPQPKSEHHNMSMFDSDFPNKGVRKQCLRMRKLGKTKTVSI